MITPANSNNPEQTNLEISISVVIPCYNAGRFLQETIQSVLRQTRPPLEVIVVDDGSTDDSKQIAESISPLVRVISQPNQGESVARNRGIDEAKGEWIALLDADDRWVPHKLERQLDVLQRGSANVVCVYSDYVLFGSETGRRCLPLWTDERERRVRLLTNPVIQPGTALVRRAAIQQAPFPVGISNGEDQIVWMQLYDHGEIIHIAEPLLEYRKHAHQQTSGEGHGVRVVDALWGWAKLHPESFSDREFALLRTEFGAQLIAWHDEAYWRGDWKTVPLARALYRELLPQNQALPPLFGRSEPSRVMYAAYRSWNTLLGALPEPLRQSVSRNSRGLIDRIKRGGSSSQSQCPNDAHAASAHLADDGKTAP